MLTPISIIIADDHQIFRHALCRLINVYKDFKVLGDVGNGIELLKLIKFSTPDILITDLEMPLMNGRELAKELNKTYPSVKIVLLSMYYSPYHAINAFDNGFNACLPKECSIETLIEAIRAVHNDGYYFKKDLLQVRPNEELLEQKFSKISNQLALSHREVEVLRLICDGYTNKAIAITLGLSTSAIDFHKQSIYKKTGVNSAVMLVKYAVRNGLIVL